MNNQNMPYIFADNESVDSVSPIGIMGAMESEIRLLKSCMESRTEQVVSTNTFYTGVMEGQPIVLVRSGIGKVNSAITAQILINQFNVQKIIFTGVAGGIHHSLDIKDVVISTHLFQHDYDTTPLGDKLADVPGSNGGRFFADPSLVELAHLAACKVMNEGSVYKGVIVSGDQFIANKKSVQILAEQFDAWAVEMEGAAVGHAATLAGIPFVIIRAISDKANGKAPSNFMEFMEEAALQSEKIIRTMLMQI